jgi:hypothetical protein
MAEGSQEPFLREVPFHCVVGGSAQTAGATAPRRGHRSRRPGAAWPAAALTFTNIHRGASWGESVNTGTRKGRPGGP